MKFHVTARSYDHITGEREVARMRKQIGEKLQQIRESGKMIEGGVFAEKRGAFFILDVNDESELFDLITPMQDFSDIETHPIVSFETMQSFFEKEMVAQEA